jgi:RimJ/RimL family protein N-acetyltransferase
MSELPGRRLSLRSLTEADAAQLYSAVESSRALLRRRMAWAGQATLSSCRDFIRAGREATGRGHAEIFGLFESRSEALVGVASLRGLPGGPAELSLWVRSDRQDRGYAGEAGRLLRDRAFQGSKLKKLYARIDPANRVARKILRKLGFRYEGCLRHEKLLNNRWIDQECWGLLRSEWSGIK